MTASDTQDTEYGIRITHHREACQWGAIRSTQHHIRHSTFDIYLVGVGGQGVLTIGEIIAETAFRLGIPVNFYPTRGMAQRGGFVRAQLRLGREMPGPAIPERGADLVIATEVSEALKAVRYVKPGGDFVLYAHVWAPTAVMLGKAPYPRPDEVAAAARAALDDGGRFIAMSPDSLPLYEGTPAPENIFTLGVALGRTQLGELLPPGEVEAVVRGRWKRGVERNLAAFATGLAFRAELDLRDDTVSNITFDLFARPVYTALRVINAPCERLTHLDHQQVNTRGATHV